MARLRLDQSHCNYHVARHLADEGWTILFTDAGRASRGGSGTQGAVLRVFEEAGWPIPDIVAFLDETLLLIEIDSTLLRAGPSLVTYKEQAKPILEAFKRHLPDVAVERMELGFGRTGATIEPETFFGATLADPVGIDLAIAFSNPREPIFRRS